MTRVIFASTTLLAGINASFATTVQAAPNYASHATRIYVNGKYVSNPYHIVAKEYKAAKQPTSCLAIWYLMQALKSLDIQSTWNGETWNLELPAGMSVDLNHPPTEQKVHSGEMAISVNGTIVQYAPRISYRDPGGNVTTSYAPIWYVMQVLRRVGIQYSWDGTNWKMAQGKNATKLDVVMNFVAALHINPDSSGPNPYDDVPANDWPSVHAGVENGYFQADSATHFGATDSFDMKMVDHAYQAYIGIPDSKMGWQAGGSLEKWSNIVGLNNGISMVGQMSTSDIAQMNVNLTRLYDGYYKDSDGTYHFVFKPYNTYLIYSTNKEVNESFVATGVENAIRNIDSITVTKHGNEEIYSAPGLSSNAPEELTIGNIGIATSNTYYSLNNGVEWKFASGFFGYDSRDPDNGGIQSPPSMVLVKDAGKTEINAAEINQFDAIAFGSVDVTWSANVPQLSYSSGSANQ